MKKKNLLFTFVITLFFLALFPAKITNAQTITEEQKKFIDLVKEEAIVNYKENNILPSLKIAQAILESSWGKSTLSIQGNNLFGVKAYSDWTGPSISLSTKEYVKGKCIRTKCKFKSYPSLSKSIKDHSILLSTDRYLKVRESKDYKEACYAIYRCGYATSPTYSESLIEIIDSFELYKYDVKPVPESKVTTPNRKINKLIYHQNSTLKPNLLNNIFSSNPLF